MDMKGDPRGWMPQYRATAAASQAARAAVHREIWIPPLQRQDRFAMILAGFEESQEVWGARCGRGSSSRWLRRSCCRRRAAGRGCAEPPADRRQAEPERHLAGHEHGELEPRGPRRLAAHRLLAFGVHRRHPGGPKRRQGRQDPVSARSARAPRREPRRLAEDGPRGRLLSARHSARDVHAVSVPDRPRRRRHPVRLLVRERQSRSAHEGHPHDRRGARRSVDGVVERPLGRRHARRRGHRQRRSHLVRSRRQLSQQCS